MLIGRQIRKVNSQTLAFALFKWIAVWMVVVWAAQQGPAGSAACAVRLQRRLPDDILQIVAGDVKEDGVTSVLSCDVAAAAIHEITHHPVHFLGADPLKALVDRRGPEAAG